MRLLFRLAFRQLRSQPSFVLTTAINMALGLLGYLLVSSFSASFRNQIETKTRQMAGSDLSISSRSPLTDAQWVTIQKTLPAGAEISHEVSLMTMVATAGRSKLVEARFVDDAFPLYSGLVLKQEKLLPVHGVGLLAPLSVWIYSEIQSQLSIQLGDTVTVGSATFTVSDVVEDDPATGSTGFTLFPRIFLKLSDLNATKLIGVGSRTQYITRIKWPIILDGDQAHRENEVITQIKKEIPEVSEIRIKSHREVSDDMTKIQSYLHEYLSLMSLMALFLSAVGVSFLMKTHLQRTRLEFAVLASLGGARWIAPSVFCLKVIVLGLLGSVLALVLEILCSPLMRAIILPLTSAAVVEPWPSVASAVRSTLVSIASGLLIALPQIVTLMRLKPSEIFKDTDPSSQTHQNISASIHQAFWYMPALILWWFMAVNESHSWMTGSIFVGVCLGLCVVLLGLSLPMFRFVNFFVSVFLPATNGLVRNHWRWTLALRMIHRNRATSFLMFLSLALGATLIQVIPQLKALISQEMARPDSVIPQLFIFDIQDDQVSALTRELMTMRAKTSYFSPIVRGRLESINHVKPEVTASQNISYRSELSASESIVHGKFMTTRFSGEGTPELSIEDSFAKKNNLKLGDQLEFDVQGVAVNGVITSIRRVRWTSFNPNFFILIQPGVLEDAPKIWTTSVYQVDQTRIYDIQAQITHNFPNINVVDIKSAVDHALQLIEQISIAINFIGWLAILSGVGVLFSISVSQAQGRRRALAILDILGATRRDRTVVFLMEYGLINGTAVLASVGLAMVASYIVAIYILHVPWVFSSDSFWTVSFWIPSFIIFSGATLMAYLAIKSRNFNHLR